MKFLIISLALMSLYTFAENKTVLEVTKETLDKKLEQLKASDQKSLEMQISSLTKDINYYIQSREKECKGEFTSIEINAKGSNETFSRKLSKEEKNLCLLELVYFRKKYIVEIFKLRAIALRVVHADQLNELDLIKKESLKALDSLTDKLNKKSN